MPIPENITVSEIANGKNKISLIIELRKKGGKKGESCCMIF